MTEGREKGHTVETSSWGWMGSGDCQTTGSVWPSSCSTQYVRGREARRPELSEESLLQIAISHSLCDFDRWEEELSGPFKKVLVETGTEPEETDELV